MTTYYISPSCLTYKQYRYLIASVDDFGWSSPFEWPVSSFRPDAFINKKIISRALKAISRSDIFIAVVPGTSSTNIELGTAFTLCEEVCLVSKDPVHFTQTGLCDAYLSALPGVKRICCNVDDIPVMLHREYIYLITKG